MLDKKRMLGMLALLTATVVMITAVPVVADINKDLDLGIQQESEDENQTISLSNSNLYTQVDSEVKNPAVSLTTEGYTQVASNSALSLYIKEENASIRVMDLESGYVWGAFEEDKPENLNKSWTAFGNSIVSLLCYDSTGNTVQIGCGHESADCTFEYEENAIICHASFPEQEISLDVRVELAEDHLQFSVDDSTIREEGKYMIGRIYFTPFLGSIVGDSVDGYMFVPDGSGALIRFKEPTKYLSGFNKRVYGYDYGVDNLFEVGDLNANRTNDFLKDDETVTMPVYGIVHAGEYALFGHVDEGAEYAGIIGEPAGITTDYNYSCAYFIYRQLYQQPTSRDGAGIQIVQQEANEVNPKLSVYFLNEEEANYNGMAHVYRNILEKQNLLPEYSSDEGGVQLDFIVADIKDGFLFDTTKELTSAEDIENAAKELKEAGITNVNFSLLGWQSGGLHGYNKTKTYKETEIGSLKEIEELSEYLKEMGNTLSLYIAPLSAKEPQTGIQSNIGISRSQSIIRLARANEDVFLGDTYYMKTAEALILLEKQQKILEEANLNSLVLDDLGSVLYGEYLEENMLNRSEVKELLRESLLVLSGEEGMTLYQPGEYLLAYTSIYRDAPMSSGRYIFETDSVPFVQLVLSGNTTLYAPYANQSFYSRSDILRCIEYNTWPSFVMTGEESDALRKTVSEELFSTCFMDWKDIIVDYYKQVEETLAPVAGQQMISHTALADGVVRIAYESGAVYVNYTKEIVVADGIELQAESAVYAKYEGGNL